MYQLVNISIMSGKELLDLPLLEIRDWIEKHLGINYLGLQHVNIKSNYKKRIHKLTELRFTPADEPDVIRLSIYRGDKVIRGKIDTDIGKVLELSRWRLVYSCWDEGKRKYAGNVLLEEYKYDG